MNRQTLGILFVVLAMQIGCASKPKISDQPISSREAMDWADRFCSKGTQAVQGDLVVRSKTAEFKGQFPASLRIEPSGEFAFEVTNIIGGTMLKLSGSPSGIDVLVPGKPNLSRKNVTHYLGLPAPVLIQVLRGDLPCPMSADRSAVRAESAKVLLTTKPGATFAGEQNWTYSRLDSENGFAPASVRIEPQGIDFRIEEWDMSANYARKAQVITKHGELRWTWKSR